MGDSETVQKSVRFPQDVVRAVTALAGVESRTFSQSVTVLLREALDARDAVGGSTPPTYRTGQRRDGASERRAREIDRAGIAGDGDPSRASSAGPVSRVLAGLGGGEPHGEPAAAVTATAAAVDASSGESALSPPPSPETHFKPDPKPGKR